jgi:hypothetical protein
MPCDANTLINIFRKRPLYSLNQNDFLKKNKPILWLSAVSFIIILVFRSFDNFSNPAFYAEDATYYFKLNYDAEFLFKNIFRNPNGYYNIVNNFLAQLIGDVDVRLQPFVYQFIAFSSTVITTILFSRSGLVQNRFLLLVTPLVLGLSGFNHILYFLTITFQMYVLVLTLFAVLLLDKQNSLVRNIVIFSIIPILVWSGPYSVLTVPFAVGFIVLFRGKTSVMLWTIAVTIAYALSTTGSTIMLGNIFVDKFQLLWFEALVKDIFLLGLREHANLEKVLLLLAIFVPAIYTIRRETFHLRLLALFMIVIVSSMAPLFLSKKFILYGSVYPCHLLLGKFFWILSLLIIIDRLLIVVPSKLKILSGSIAMSCIVVFVIFDNLKHEGIRKIEILSNITEFLQTIHQTENLKLEKKNEYYRITADGSGRFMPTAHVGSHNSDAKMAKAIHIRRNSISPEFPK